jgi:hypothetical protein
MDENKQQPGNIVPQMATPHGPVNGAAGLQPRVVMDAPAAGGLDEIIPGTGAWHAAALDIARGTSRFLRALGCAVVAEIPLADGRRADLMALDPRGAITIVEVKSCLNDFRTDHKWEDYRQWCDRFFFAVDCDFPQEHIPGDCGLIVADRFDAEALRDPPQHRLDASRRKAVTLRFARCAAFRLHGADDPDIW